MILFSLVAGPAGWAMGGKLSLSPKAEVSSSPSPSPLPSPAASVSAEAANREAVAEWCTNLDAAFVALKWKAAVCSGLNWQISGFSAKGRPLVYAEFGSPDAPNTTVVFTMVHGDEITPLYLGIQLAHWMKENQASLPMTRVVIAPLVNPDGFYVHPRTRVNARGVDINRNFATRDWNERALKAWKLRFHSDPRRYPGPAAGTEPETQFQVELIRRFHPQKVLSVHAPLNFMDYDGPTVLSLARFPREYVRECLKLRTRLKAITSGFFPGSLGNYAGQGLGIPTLTLELPSATPFWAEKYWTQFKTGIRTMIEYKVPDFAARRLGHEDAGHGS